MISTSNNSLIMGIDNLQNETDKLLSDKYILAKEIRDLIRTIKNSKTTLSNLILEIKNKLKRIDQLEKDINKVDEKDLNQEIEQLTENILTLNNEITYLREKAERINLADADAVLELGLMKTQLKEIEEEISGYKYNNEQ